AIFGGFAGSVVMLGIKRGLYSNEAGMGTHFHIDHLGLIAAIAHEDTRVYLSARDEELFRGRGASYRRSRAGKEEVPPPMTRSNLDRWEDCGEAPQGT
ncbi:MBL fold metallo-hydrolase, partial [Eggerthella lenta]|uniref:MBL fold metallo-hydrolase n=1 Tax=Eggerthella lenta TaxID=84112 RepID=UPI00210D7962